MSKKKRTALFLSAIPVIGLFLGILFPYLFGRYSIGGPDKWFLLFMISPCSLLISIIFVFKSWKGESRRFLLTFLLMNILLCFACFVLVIGLHFNVISIGTFHRATNGIDAQQLQEWAEKVIETSQSGDHIDKFPFKKGENEYPFGMVRDDQYLIKNGLEYKQKHVMISFGGGFYDCGLYVGNKSFVAESGDRRVIHKRADGIYTWQE